MFGDLDDPLAPKPRIGVLESSHILHLAAFSLVSKSSGSPNRPARQIRVSSRFYAMHEQGTPSNLHASRQSSVVGNCIMTGIITVVVVVLRLITRIRVVRKVGWDDYTIIAAALGQVVGMSLNLVKVHYGFGHHRGSLHESTYIEFEKYSYANWIQLFQTLMFNKLSVCFFLLRISVGRKYIRPIQGAIVVLIASNVILTFLWIFQCWPVAAAWNKRRHNNCLTGAQLQRIIFSQAFISIISDVLLALFPIVLLWNVKISARLKAGLCSLMALGLITAALCTVRTVLNWQTFNFDHTWEAVLNYNFRTWEVCMGITAACIPAMWPGFRVVSTSISTYYSLRYRSSSLSHQQSPYKGGFAGYSTAKTEAKFDDLEEKTHLANEITYPDLKVSNCPAIHGTANMVSVQAGRAAKVEAGDEIFPAGGTVEDLGTMDGGITKTTWFGTGSEAESRNGSLENGDVERGDIGQNLV